MRNNRLLIIAVVLIAFGLIGIFATAWFVSYREPRSMFQMPGMMMDGMMGDGMMNRDEMKDMMRRMMPGMLPPSVIPRGPSRSGQQRCKAARLLLHTMPRTAESENAFRRGVAVNNQSYVYSHVNDVGNDGR